MQVPYLPPGGALPLQAGQSAAWQAAGWFVSQGLAVEGPEWAFALRVEALHVPMAHGLTAAHRALKRDKQTPQSSDRVGEKLLMASKESVSFC